MGIARSDEWPDKLFLTLNHQIEFVDSPDRLIGKCQPLLDVMIHLDRSSREGDWVLHVSVSVCELEEFSDNIPGFGEINHRPFIPLLV